MIDDMRLLVGGSLIDFDAGVNERMCFTATDCLLLHMRQSAVLTNISVFQSLYAADHVWVVR